MNHGAGLLTVVWVESALGLIFLVARIYTRIKIVKKIGLDDWTMIFATVSVKDFRLRLCFEVVDHARVTELDPGGCHLRRGYYASTLRSWQACCLYPTTTIFLWILIVLLFVINLLLTIITSAQCNPASWLWDQFNPTIAGYSGSCWIPNIRENYGYFQGGKLCTPLSRHTSSVVTPAISRSYT